ncbi:MAG: GNAT family N-acetyltransferase [Austwickia sp.]|nr:GNAT family N-acetyltransferase [Austwickia sp.]
MTLQVREATDADLPAMRRLGWEAFAPPVTVQDCQNAPAPPVSDSRVVLAHRGTQMGEELVGKAVDLALTSWYGGRPVETSGVAGVAIAAEHRGRGVLEPLLDRLLTGARARGAVISTLYPTAPGIYRRFGYEVIGSYQNVQVPTWTLPRAARRMAELSAPQPLTAPARLRRAVDADWPRIQACHQAWATDTTGALSRVGPRFAGSLADLARDVTAVTVAEDPDDPAGPLAGYCCWARVGGYREQGAVEVSDLIATGVAGRSALLAMLGSHEPTARVTRFLAGSGADLPWLLGDDVITVVSATPYMLAILDVPQALAARGFPRCVAGTAELTVSGPAPVGVPGRYRLTWSDGRAYVEGISPAPADVVADTWVTAGGLALWYAGTLRSAALRRLGLLGGDGGPDELLDTAFGAVGPVGVRDYF